MKWQMRDERLVKVFERFDLAMFAYSAGNQNLDAIIQCKVDSMFNISGKDHWIVSCV